MGEIAGKISRSKECLRNFKLHFNTKPSITSSQFSSELQWTPKPLECIVLLYHYTKHHTGSLINFHNAAESFRKHHFHEITLPNFSLQFGKRRAGVKTNGILSTECAHINAFPHKRSKGSSHRINLPSANKTWTDQPTTMFTQELFALLSE